VSTGRDDGVGAPRPRALHPELTAAEKRARITTGMELFATARYFDAHEAWEEVWRSTTPEPRDLFQGLVQAAAAFHHLRVRRRPDVARRVLAKACRRLASVADDAAGVDVAALRRELAPWEEWLMRAQGDEPPLPCVRWR
jgi:predicted metal-dependent hydrolase